MHPFDHRLAQAILAVWLGACVASSDSTPSGLTTVRLTAGDTTIVRTSGDVPESDFSVLVPEFTFGEVAGRDELNFGAIDFVRVTRGGNILVFDRQAIALRVFDSAGKFVRNIGRAGDGPGEFRRAYGLTVLNDNRIALWENDNNRVHFYSSQGEFEKDIVVPDPGGFEIQYVMDALSRDNSGNVYVRCWVGTEGRRRITGYLQIRADGTIGDSLLPPRFGLREADLVAAFGGSVSSTSIPHYPEEFWAWSSHGYYVGGRGDIYAIHLLHNNGKVTRIERTVNQVPVNSEQRKEAIESAIRSMTHTDPKWQWTGPESPFVKPYAAGVAIDDDGRIWVRVPRPTKVLSEAERPTRSPPGGGPPVPYGSRFREEFVYEVFEPDGSFLGTVRAAGPSARMTYIGNRAWGITRDSNDVQLITRFRIEPPLERAGR